MNQPTVVVMVHAGARSYYRRCYTTNVETKDVILEGKAWTSASVSLISKIDLFKRKKKNLLTTRTNNNCAMSDGILKPLEKKKRQTLSEFSVFPTQLLPTQKRKKKKKKLFLLGTSIARRN